MTFAEKIRAVVSAVTLSRAAFDEEEKKADMSDAWRTLLGAFSAAGGYSLLGSAAPRLQSFPVFSWAGLPGVTAWGWELALSPGIHRPGWVGLAM